MRHPDLAVSLCHKATQMRAATVSAAAAEAVLRAYPDAGHPIPRGAFTAFWEQVRLCWEDKEPWGLRYRLADQMEGLRCEDPAGYEVASSLLQTTLSDKRIHGFWSMEQQGRIGVVVKELGRRMSERRGG